MDKIKMLEDKSLDCTIPLLEDAGDHEEETRGSTWWKKVLDLEEAKNQVLFSLPMILTNIFYYAIPLVSVMVAGHLGQLELAAASLANSWATFGYSCMTGLSGALETLCGQGFGAKQYKTLGVLLQASCIITCFFSIIVSILWFYTEPILILLHQDPDVSKQAALYMWYLIPGIFAYGFLQNILRFLQTQSIVKPLVFLSALPMAIHCGIAYSLVHLTSLGFKGASLATSVSLWISTLSLSIFVFCAKEFEDTWEGFSSESFNFIFILNLKLALLSAALVCLEFWAFDILVFLAGLMPNSQITTSLIAMYVNTEDIGYMITYAFSAAASTRVSNELGAGNVIRAKNGMTVTLKLVVLLSFTVVVTVAFGHNIWASYFSDSSEVIKEFASLTPFLATSMAIEPVQAVLLGVRRGCGWQNIAVWLNLASFYLIGIPIGVLLGLKFKLHAKGLWIGLICGLSSQTSALLLITLCRKWTKSSIPVNKGEETPV